MFASVSRRDLLRHVSSTAFALATGLPAGTRAWAATAPSLDGFMSLSGKLTGHSDLDPEMGKNILAAFTAAGQAPELAALVADPAPEANTSKLANALVAAWYSGLSPVAAAREVTGFNSALLWDTLSYTKPWGSCGGATGYWADPPSEEGP